MPTFNIGMIQQCTMQNRIAALDNFFDGLFRNSYGVKSTANAPATMRLKITWLPLEISLGQFLVLDV